MRSLFKTKTGRKFLNKVNYENTMRILLSEMSRCISFVRKLKVFITLLQYFYCILYFYFNNRNYSRKIVTTVDIQVRMPTKPTTKYHKSPSLDSKYILLWTNSHNYPFVYFGEGNTVFKNKKCKFNNCYVTSNRDLLGHYSEFEVIAFNGPQLHEAMLLDDMPKVRSRRQKYVYANIEAGYIYDGFFNWTWTYKLNSDAVWGYFIIKNSSNHIIGPSMNILWLNEENFKTINIEVKSKLLRKQKAAAWFVSNCRTISGRERYANDLQHYMNSYNLKLDIYGECGDFQCPKNIMNRCLDELEHNYYFYLAFENALSEDYVTEKVLHAFNHYTVPIVEYSGANYSRFMPPGSYIDATELGPQMLAAKLYEIIQNTDLYHKFFRWRQHYSYHFRHESPETDDYCRFCALLNDETVMNNITIYNNFSAWWTPEHACAGHYRRAERGQLY